MPHTLNTNRHSYALKQLLFSYQADNRIIGGKNSILIKGTADQIAKAKALIEEIVDEDDYSRPRYLMFEKI